jgi:hypothetical protein
MPKWILTRVKNIFVVIVYPKCKIFHDKLTYLNVPISVVRWFFAFGFVLHNINMIL